MKGSDRKLALFAALVVLGTPASFGCLGVGMTAPCCPMAEMTGVNDGGMPDMAGHCASSIDSTTSGAGCVRIVGATDPCCEMDSPPEPIDARAINTQEEIALELVDFHLGASQADERQPLDASRAVPPELNDLGRYTLFSTFLL